MSLVRRGRRVFDATACFDSSIATVIWSQGRMTGESRAVSLHVSSRRVDIGIVRGIQCCKDDRPDSTATALDGRMS